MTFVRFNVIYLDSGFPSKRINLSITLFTCCLHKYCQLNTETLNRMRFTIKQAGCGSERVGSLTGFVRSSGAVIETPTSALLTQGGSVVNLTADVLLRVFQNPQLLWVPLSNSVHLETGVKAQGEGVAKFASLPEHVTCTTLHNINEVAPPGHFEQNKVPLWTKRSGKMLITADRYMDVMEVFKPDIILAIADGRTSLNEGSKRISKSVDRTCNMFDTCIKRYKDSNHLQDSSLVGVIVGAGQTNKCNDCIQHLLKYKEDLSGIALSGITDGTEESLKSSSESLEHIFKKIGEALPKELMRVVEGCWNPAVVVGAIEHGWDVFDGSYPVKLTNAGHALALTFEVIQNDELCILDLNDMRYKEDFAPVLKDCECLACKKHTRAYICHLLNTREMLAQVLLSIHNLHHFDQMFHHARRHIAANTFEVYKHHITQQYDLYKRSQNTNPKSEVAKEGNLNSVDESAEKERLQQKKKIRVSNDIKVDYNVDVAVDTVEKL